MKKILYFAAGIAALAGCQKTGIVPDEANPSVQTIICSIPEETKTSINGVKTTWETGDKIIVVADKNTGSSEDDYGKARRAWSEYSLESGEGTGLATFNSTFINPNQTLTGKIVAIYPGDYGWDVIQWNNYNKGSEDFAIQKERFQSCDTYIAVPIKKVQTYIPTNDGTVNLKMPMYAISTSGVGDGQELIFKPLYGVVRFTVSAATSTPLDKVVLTTSSGNTILSGQLFYWKPLQQNTPTFGDAVKQRGSYFDPEYSVEVQFPSSFSIGAGETITVNAITYPWRSTDNLTVSLYEPGNATPIKTGTVRNLKVEAGKISAVGNLSLGGE